MEKKYAFGVPGLHYIWNGTNADPLVIYKGLIFNYWDVADGIDNMIHEYLDIDWSEDISDDNWCAWTKDNRIAIWSMLDDWIDSSVEAVTN